MKRILRLLAALGALWMFSACALAEEAPIASYEMPEGGRMCHVLEAQTLEAPSGLEALYEAMRQVSPSGDVYLVQMPHGRALASVSCQRARRDFTAEELLALWPQIAQNLGESALTVAGDETCARVEQMYGYPMLHIQVGLLLDGDLGVEAEGFAFCRDGELREVWAVRPSPDLYAPQSAEAEELAADAESLAWFLQRLSFPLEASEERYTYQTGLFSMTLPEDAVVLAPDATEEERSRVRQTYEAANAAGASTLFDGFEEDQRENGAWYVFTPDMRGAASITALPNGGLALDRDALLSLAQVIRAALEEEYGLALCLDDAGAETISGLEHAALTYWVRAGEMNVLLDVLACETDGWLYEVDVYAADGDPEAHDTLWDWLMPTLAYHPPMNALE